MKSLNLPCVKLCTHPYAEVIAEPFPTPADPFIYPVTALLYNGESRHFIPSREQHEYISIPKTQSMFLTFQSIIILQ
jgi:hypothetical protein